MSKLNGPGTLLYRCKLCGEVHGPTGVPSLLVALIEIQQDGFTGDPRRGMTASEKQIHNCADGRLGMSELVGGTLT